MHGESPIELLKSSIHDATHVVAQWVSQRCLNHLVKNELPSECLNCLLTRGFTGLGTGQFKCTMQFMRLRNGEGNSRPRRMLLYGLLNCLWTDSMFHGVNQRL